VPTFSVNMKHTVESRPMFNTDLKNKFMEVVSKREDAAQRHGVKVLSAWTSTLQHLIFYIVEASSRTALEDYFKEIGFAFWNDVEIRQVRPVEDVLKSIEKS